MDHNHTHSRWAHPTEQRKSANATIGERINLFHPHYVETFLVLSVIVVEARV